MRACECDSPEHKFRGVLRNADEGTGLSLFCSDCEGWIEDSWLVTDGIPVEVTVESSQDVTGEWLITFTLVPAALARLREVTP